MFIVKHIISVVLFVIIFANQYIWVPDPELYSITVVVALVMLLHHIYFNIRVEHALKSMRKNV